MRTNMAVAMRRDRSGLYLAYDRALRQLERVVGDRSYGLPEDLVRRSAGRRQGRGLVARALAEIRTGGQAASSSSSHARAPTADAVNTDDEEA
jgi:hypothetical protein